MVLISFPGSCNLGRERELREIGTEEPWLSAACARIEQSGATVVVCIDGFQPMETYVEKIQGTTPDLIVLGMGMPKQELLAARLIKHLDQRPCLILNGGAILDFLADRFPRAPDALRRLRMEWMFRLLMEPQRLWRRYILGGLIFSMKIVQVAWICRRGGRVWAHGALDVANDNAKYAERAPTKKAIVSN